MKKKQIIIGLIAIVWLVFATIVFGWESVSEDMGICVSIGIAIAVIEWAKE